MNLERFKQTLVYIETHPEEWCQVSLQRCFMALANYLFGHGKAKAMFVDTYKNPLEVTEVEYEWLFNGGRTLEDFRQVAATGVIPCAALP